MLPLVRLFKDSPLFSYKGDMIVEDCSEKIDNFKDGIFAFHTLHALVTIQVNKNGLNTGMFSPRYCQEQ